MSPERYQNLHPHPRQGLRDVLRWQFGLGPREELPPALGDCADSPPAVPWPREEGQTPPDPQRVRLTWIGHSTFLIQHRGRSILTDPIFGNCGPPLPLARLHRRTPPGVPLPALPPITDVLISHCHYDHLDAPTIRRLGGRPNYWVPAGLAAWFHSRNFPRTRELEWGAGADLGGGVELHCVPAQPFAARNLGDRNRTHWCGWVLRSADRAVYFAGDTGYCPVFRTIGERFGGFDLALIPIGASRPRWLMKAMHVDPREAVQIHLDVRSRLSVACHWGTFALADEPLSEPPRLLRAALAERALPAAQFRALAFGESLLV